MSQSRTNLANGGGIGQLEHRLSPFDDRRRAVAGRLVEEEMFDGWVFFGAAYAVVAAIFAVNGVMELVGRNGITPVNYVHCLALSVVWPVISVVVFTMALRAGGDASQRRSSFRCLSDRREVGGETDSMGALASWEVEGKNGHASASGG